MLSSHMLYKTILLILVYYICHTQTYSHLSTIGIGKQSLKLTFDGIDSHFEEYHLLDIDEQNQKGLKVVPFTKECLFRINSEG